MGVNLGKLSCLEDNFTHDIPDHNGEADFNAWNTGLTESRRERGLTGETLYRATTQPPEDVFKKDGALLPSAKLEPRTRELPDADFSTTSMRNHVEGKPSNYVSTTTRLDYAQKLAAERNRNFIYVIDPQGNGRSPLKVLDRKTMLEGQAKKLFEEREISVPNAIPTKDIRGVLPVNPNSGSIDYAGLRKNEEYKP